MRPKLCNLAQKPFELIESFLRNSKKRLCSLYCTGLWSKSTFQMISRRYKLMVFEHRISTDSEGSQNYAIDFGSSSLYVRPANSCFEIKTVDEMSFFVLKLRKKNLIAYKRKQRNTKSGWKKSLNWSIKQNLRNHRWCWIYVRLDKLVKAYQFCAGNCMHGIHWTANSSKSSHLFVWRTVINANFRCLNWKLVLCCSFWSESTSSSFALIVGDVAIGGIAWRILDRSWAQAEKNVRKYISIQLLRHMLDLQWIELIEMGGPGHGYLESRAGMRAYKQAKQMNQIHCERLKRNEEIEKKVPFPME